MNIQLQPASVTLLAKLDLDLALSIATVPLHQRPEYITAIHYLTDCTEQEDELSIHLYIQNMLDACYCLCEIQAWDLVRRILLTPLHPTQPNNLDELLNAWRSPRAQIELYTSLLGKFDRRTEAILLRGLGDAYLHMVTNQFTQSYFEQSRALFLADGAGLEAAQLLHRLGMFALHSEGALSKTERYLLQAQTELCAFEDPKTLAQVFNDLAQVAVQRGDFQAARGYYLECLDLHTRQLSSDEILLAWFYISIGQCCRHQGDFNDATAYLRRGIRLFQQQEQFAGRVWALMEWSSLLAAQTKYQAACNLLRYLLTKEDPNQPGPLVAWACHLSGRIALKTDNYAQAYDLFHKVLRIQKQLGHQVGMIYAIDGIACALVHLQRYTEGAGLFGAVAVLRKEQQLHFPPFDQADAERSLAQLEGREEQNGWRTAWVEGQRLSLEQAVMKALAMQPLGNEQR